MSSFTIQELQDVRLYFETGVTLPYQFRIQQLLALKQAIIKYETEISAVLYADLKKSPEESYATETGLLLAEINTTLRNLRSWMRPESVPTNLPNFPSSSKIYRDPLGVVLIIAPWNYPLQLLLTPLVGAIAGGNCVILKPSELATATALIIEKIISEIFSPFFIKVVQGDGSEVIPAMMKNFRFDHVFFTGSIPVGKLIYEMAATKLVPVTLELGGKSPAIVEKDANLPVAAKRIAMGKFTNAGQTCIAPDYVLVHNDVKEKFVSLLKDSIIRFYSNDPSNSDDYGKIINENRFDKVISYMGQGTITHGGTYNKSELFVAPTVIENISADAPLMTEEIFGPVLPVFTFEKREEAMSAVQRNANPLAFYLFTANKEVEKEWLTKVPFGGGCVNNTLWHFGNHHLPFGGVYSSGLGAYHGKYTFKTFTHEKPVLNSPTWFDPMIKYAPLKGKLKLLKWLIR